MKKAYEILSHLTSQPQFRLLKKQACYTKFIKLLGAKYQNAIAFVYIKNETLFVAVIHPVFKMELNYNRDLLKSVLTQLNTYVPECSDMKAKEIVVFHSKYYPVEEQKPLLSTVPHYQERSTSNFEIQTSDPTLKKKFEQIQDDIRCNRS
ncbi:MAG: DUF721 domain-containing protein [Campylobacterales bacterium]|nr:DUF721 domain-containing protein [Campylobacterales bacterium]